MIDPKTNANQGGPTAIEKACQDLIKAQSGGDPVEIARAFKSPSRSPSRCSPAPGSRPATR